MSEENHEDEFEGYEEFGGDIITMNDILEYEQEEEPYLLGDWLAYCSCTMINAPTGVGKSFFSIGIGMAIAGAGRILNWDAKYSVKVLYVNGEMSIDSVRKRIQLLNKTMYFNDADSVGTNFGVAHGDEVKYLDAEGAFRHYRNLVNRYGIGLIIFDNIRTLTKMQDENKASEWIVINDLLIKLRDICTVIIVHHDGKGKGYSGSTNAVTVLDNQISLSPVSQRDCIGQNLKDAGLRFSYKFNKCRDTTGADIASKIIGLHDEKGWVDNTSRALKTSIDVTATAELAESGKFDTWNSLASHIKISNQGLSKRRQKYKELYGKEMKLLTPKLLLKKQGLKYSEKSISNVFDLPSSTS